MKDLIEKLLHIVRATREPENKPLTKVLLDLVNYSSRLGLSPGEYFTYGLHGRKATTDYCLGYLPNALHFQDHLATLNNTATRVLNDKLLFKTLMNETGVAIPRTIGYAGPATREDLSFERITETSIREVLATHKLDSFLVKPATGKHGKGIHIVSYSPDSLSSFRVGEQCMDASEFFNFLGAHCCSLKSDYILFEYVVPPPETLKKISPSASPNVRIITLMLPDGEVVVTSASIRLGRSQSVTSNAASGGLTGRIDRQTGTITGCRTTGYMLGEFVHDHPDTLAPITGVVVPGWNDVLSTCTTAAAAVPDVRSIGWDVLIGEGRPVIVEGNERWGIIGEQLLGEGYLSDRNRRLLEGYGLRFAEHTMPPPSLRKLRLALFGGSS